MMVKRIIIVRNVANHFQKKLFSYLYLVLKENIYAVHDGHKGYKCLSIAGHLKKRINTIQFMKATKITNTNFVVN